MLVDFHAHSQGISRCCKIAYDEVIRQALAAGIQGIILTNHYKRSYAKDGNYKLLAESYKSEHLAAKKYGEELGVRVFFGVEVTMDTDADLHMLVYGVPPEFITANPEVFAMSQAQLYQTVHAWGGALVQAHPFRRGMDKLTDLRLLDGIEINCHPLPRYLGTHIEKISKIAKDAGLILTSGGDYHADTHRPKCGVYLPDDFDERKIADFILHAPEVTLAVQEVGATESYDYTFKRKLCSKNSDKSYKDNKGEQT